jgi:hypothetical protein
MMLSVASQIFTSAIVIMYVGWRVGKLEGTVQGVCKEVKQIWNFIEKLTGPKGE